eukprot:TRINITY_DN25394_c0_g1_i2.p1 TRINITY_DN25394_c0_g1~~TRINITY_DN25394_c0_g1_i2.p1  ORF type:complete len:302 (+),score=24.57 TRINITY_DN25394_c0_g1_i2:80-985(+)
MNNFWLIFRMKICEELRLSIVCLILIVGFKYVKLQDCSAWNASFPSVGVRCEESWMNYAQKLNQEIKQQDKLDVIFFGDSISEQLLATREGGQRCPWCDQKTAEMFQGFIKKQGWNVFVSAISGDQTAQLLWRLKNGQLERDLTSVKLVFVLIGTNDLHAPAKQLSTDSKQLVNFVTERINSIVEVIQKSMVNSRIVVFGLLPRGNGTVEQFFDPSTLQPDDFLINNQYTPYILQINQKLKKQYRENFLDCGRFFLTKDGNLDREMMKDTIHPTTLGWASLFSCIERFLKQIGQYQQKEDL